MIPIIKFIGKKCSFHMCSYVCRKIYSEKWKDLHQLGKYINTFYYDFLVSPWLVTIILAWNPIRYPSISYSLLFTFSANVHYSITSKMKSNLHFATWNMTWSIKIFFCTCAVFEQRNYITMSQEQSLIAFSLAMYSSTFCFPWNAFNVGWD